MQTTTYKPILKYPGAKNVLAAWIVQYFPRQGINHYAEPYCGSAAVLLNKTHITPHEVINDLDGDIVNLFSIVRTRGDELAAQIELTPYARQEYYASYETCDEPIERARRFLVRSWQAHGFKLHGRTGWRNNGSKSLQPVTNLWRDVPNRIRSVIDRLRCVEIESAPALAIVERYATKDTLLYADPPYPLATRKGRKLYRHEMTDADHLTLLDALDAHPGAVVLSGYRCALYDNRLSHWHSVETTAQAEKGQARTEVLWLNKAAANAQQMNWLHEAI